MNGTQKSLRILNGTPCILTDWMVLLRASAYIFFSTFAGFRAKVSASLRVLSSDDLQRVAKAVGCRLVCACVLVCERAFVCECVRASGSPKLCAVVWCVLVYLCVRARVYVSVCVPAGRQSWLLSSCVCVCTCVCARVYV